MRQSEPLADSTPLRRPQRRGLMREGEGRSDEGEAPTAGRRAWWHLTGIGNGLGPSFLAPRLRSPGEPRVAERPLLPQRGGRRASEEGSLTEMKSEQ